MVINRSEMKRKRREDCSSPLLDDSPKRTKVHAQRKFAQGSNVNSPVITPVKEIEKQEIDVLPEPVELLPIKRPNTEDFLTFLCFRGTPILPPSLNFFNTASIVDTNGQVHEIKSESPKNGPIDTSAITKTGSGSSERPFVAFGVRKRADPIVISRQMDKKRRHALALQALRRKYQEQRMAKIRAVTIISKTEPLAKKSNTLQKSKLDVPTKHVKVTTRSVKAALRPQIKQKMCLRSFRGRFVQKELQFRNVKKRPLQGKKMTKDKVEKKTTTVEESSESEYSSDDEKPLSKTSKDVKVSPKVILPKIAKKSAPGPKKPIEIKVTRSNKFLNSKIVSRRQQIKQRMLMTTPKTIVKPRTLRSHTAQNSKILPETKQKIMQKMKHKTIFQKDAKNIIKKESICIVKKAVRATECTKKEAIKKDGSKIAENQKKEKPAENPKRITNKPPAAVKKEISPNPTASKSKLDKPSIAVKKESVENAKKTKIITKTMPTTAVKKMVSSRAQSPLRKDNLNKKKTVILKKGLKTVESSVKKEPAIKKEFSKEESDKKEDAAKVKVEQKECTESKTSQRPTRKTKEAAAIYMEILSHKLVNESKIDDDNVSIDSFPELPNVKKTEQRENELKARARSGKTSESEGDSKKPTKGKEAEVTENKNLRSNDKKKINTQKKNENPDVKNVDKNPEDNGTLEGSNKKGNNEADLKKKSNVEVETTKEEKSKKVSEEARKVSVKLDSVKEEVQICDRKTRSATQEKMFEKVVASPIEKMKDAELKVHINPINVDTESKRVTSKVESKESTTPTLKKKYVEKLDVDESSESDISLEELRVKKLEEKVAKFGETESTKRQTRNSSLNIRHVESDDSDESFRADIRIPRKKQITRSKVSKFEDESPLSDNKMNLKKSLRANTRIYKECSSSDSDHSTTSDVDIKQIKVVNKNKKFTKTRSQLKGEQSFSDSDEEPLSKLTQLKNTEMKEGAELGKDENNFEKKVKVDPDMKHVKTNKDSKVDSESDNFKKPKRECAKRPQNYLPMFSSSDEEDNYFQGFKSKNEISKPLKSEKIPEAVCSHASTSLDLSCKDIGRRFGKGKVNMSNEQIEKWLKDSAMAGSSVKNENDAMLKFGEKIPTETSLSIATSIDTEKLKTLLITGVEKQEIDSGSKDSSSKNTSLETAALNKINVAIKPTMADRKLIFRNKDKVGAAPNINAFSASNESSVYAFGEETEDVMKTPFRRPTRRPSSTATSRSEDESSKYEEIPRTGQFRKPPLMKQDSVKSTKESVHGDETSEDNAQLDAEDSAFYIPLQPQKSSGVNTKGKPVVSTVGQNLDKKPVASTSMVPPTTVTQKLTNLKYSLKQSPRTFDKNLETPEESKYKVPSSPSASSSSSAKLYKRQSSKPKFRATEVLPVKLPEFPTGGNCGQLIEAPTFHPSDKEFQDPLEYLEKIRPKAEQFGICRIVPPSTFKPECKVTDDMRFTAYNQIARNTMSMWFKTSEPLAQEVEQEFWKHVTLKQNHICVHSGSIDSGNWGYGFAVSKNSPFARHAWNLKVLTNNSGSVLRSIGPVMEAPSVRKKKKLQDEDGEYECEICRMNLFVSMVTESQEDGVYCLDHAAEYIEKKKIQTKHCKLTYTYDDQELEGLVDKIKSTIANKMQKKIPHKYAGMPTLLTK
ncbi:JmjN and/or zf-C5HC2 domain containing protein [Asbolus verrucosus]|uniref:JmjN and/or zf-C5HC2 domain containing protein n=1 Tax=Asbolus verrucosus TaxID=1661398 RepID=A0A482VBM6_ASBVE|nr:JmjN and/or zf-C5HC2 domain containing protein [Asbolus verrucosus]